MTVVMIDVLGEDRFELMTMEDQHPIETFPTDRANETFGEGIRPWGSDWRADDPDALGAEDFVEADGELGVAIANQEPDRSSPLSEHHGQVAGLLDDPCSSRVGRDSVHVDPSRIKLDEEKHVEATKQHRVDGEEVACQH